jgi:hypothetical protein
MREVAPHSDRRFGAALSSQELSVRYHRSAWNWVLPLRPICAGLTYSPVEYLSWVFVLFRF